MISWLHLCDSRQFNGLFTWVILPVNIVKCTEYIFWQKKSELCLEIKKKFTNANEEYYALLPLLKGQSVLKAEKIKIYKILIRPVATYGAESWALNKDIAKEMDAFGWKIRKKERKKKMNVWEIKVN